MVDETAAHVIKKAKPIANYVVVELSLFEIIMWKRITYLNVANLWFIITDNKLKDYFPSALEETEKTVVK